MKRMMRPTTRSRRSLGLLATGIAAGALVVSTQAFAQDGDEAPLLTVGVDATRASLTDATYSLLVANHGNATATEVVLVNTVPVNMRFLASDRPRIDPDACQPGAAAGSTCRWALGEIAAGSSERVSISYTLEQSDAAYPAFPPEYSFSNTASVDDQGETRVDTDSSLVRTFHVLDQDAYVDAALPEKNFGACNELKVRRDNTQTTFIDNDAISAAFGKTDAGTGVESFGGAELRAEVASIPLAGAGTPIPIAVHRVVSHDWDEGAACGADGSGRQVRAAAEPQSDASSAASAPVTGAGPVRWDIGGALDTLEERDEFSGFELRAGAAPGPGDDTVAFHSSETTPQVPADSPRLVTLSIRGEPGRCIDSDPEETTGPSDREQRIDAYVSELAFDAERISGTGGDACPGTPLPGAPVGWELDDDSPDAYISNLAGTPVPRGVGSSGDAGPNRISARTGADGRTSIAARLAEPYTEGANNGENRIAAILLKVVHGVNEDPSEFGESGVCEPGELENDGFIDQLVNQQCQGTGEASNEDDVLVGWEPVPAPPPEPSTNPPASPPTQLGAAPARDLSLTATPQRVRPGGDALLQGQMTSSVMSCGGAGELIRLLSRVSGGGTYEDFATAVTDADGRFALPVDVEQSTDYIAIASGHDDCAATVSQPASVLTAADVMARPSAKKVDRGEPVKIRGRVEPDPNDSEVVLQRRSGKRWTDLASRALKSEPEFRFTVNARWTGAREFRVRWISLSEDRLLGISGNLKVRTVGGHPSRRR